MKTPKENSNFLKDVWKSAKGIGIIIYDWFKNIVILISFIVGVSYVLENYIDLSIVEIIKVFKNIVIILILLSIILIIITLLYVFIKNRKLRKSVLSSSLKRALNNFKLIYFIFDRYCFFLIVATTFLVLVLLEFYNAYKDNVYFIVGVVLVIIGIEFILIVYYFLSRSVFKSEKYAKRSINRYLSLLIFKTYWSRAFAKFKKLEFIFYIIGHANISIFHKPCWRMYRSLLKNWINIRVLMLNPFNKEIMVRLGSREKKELRKLFNSFPKRKFHPELKILLKTLLKNLEDHNNTELWPQIIIFISLSYWIKLMCGSKEKFKVEIKLMNYPEHIKAYVIGKKRAYIGHYDAPYTIGYLNSMNMTRKGAPHFEEYISSIWESINPDNVGEDEWYRLVSVDHKDEFIDLIESVMDNDERYLEIKKDILQLITNNLKGN